jgi:hypothetical protein
MYNKSTRWQPFWKMAAQGLSGAKSEMAQYPNLFKIHLSTSVPNLVLLSPFEQLL